jgi:hypothetical protein
MKNTDPFAVIELFLRNLGEAKDVSEKEIAEAFIKTTEEINPDTAKVIKVIDGFFDL